MYVVENEVLVQKIIMGMNFSVGILSTRVNFLSVHRGHHIRKYKWNVRLLCLYSGNFFETYEFIRFYISILSLHKSVVIFLSLKSLGLQDFIQIHILFTCHIIGERSCSKPQKVKSQKIHVFCAYLWNFWQFLI